MYDGCMDLANKMVATLLPMTAISSSSGQRGKFGLGPGFVDWLAMTGQSGWQLLPLNQTELEEGSSSVHVPSPYKGYGIGLDPRFLSDEKRELTTDEMEVFMSEHDYWVDGYALFCALRDHFGTDRWTSWPAEIARYDHKAVLEWRAKLESQVSAHVTIQAKLHREYSALRQYARARGVYLIGDMPFYIGLNSPLVWQHQNLFERGGVTPLSRVSGVLKGLKSHYGRQVWGHPLYAWGEVALQGQLKSLFEDRIRHLASLFDFVRFDHAKGLFSYGAIDLANPQNDRYERGPGAAFFDQLIEYAQRAKLSLFAEDTGDKLLALRACLTKHNLPGVKIFRFAYNEKRKIFSKQYLEIDKYQENTFAYTTTHDTDTLMGYLGKLSAQEIVALRRKLKVKDKLSLGELATLIRTRVISSPAKYVVIPLQDWLLSTTRINTPGTEREHNDPNWRYVMEVGVEELPGITWPPR